MKQIKCKGAVVRKSIEGAKEYMRQQSLREDLYEPRWCRIHRGYHIWYSGKRS